MSQFNALQQKDAVVIVVNGRRALELGWKAAREVCTLMGAQLRDPPPAGETSLSVVSAHLSFRRQPKLANEVEDMLLCIANGALLFDAPLSVARQIWTLFTGAARLAEEWASAEAVAADAAILARTGAPIGLTNHPKIQAEAKKLAEGDSNLRRYIPIASPRAGVLSAPRVFHDKRSAPDQLAALFAKGGAAQRQSILTKLVPS